MNINNDGDSHGFDQFYHIHNKLVLTVRAEMNLVTMKLVNFAIHEGAKDYTFAVKNLDGLLYERLEEKIKDAIIEKYKLDGAQL